MHLDHDHDETVHTHTHTHADGVTHTHAHTHEHDLEGEHTHSHEACAEHTHCGSCEGCGQHSPKEELMALMKYMVGHNTSHANELANLAKQLQDLGLDELIEIEQSQYDAFIKLNK